MPGKLRLLPVSIGTMVLLASVKLAALAQALGPAVAVAGASAGRTVVPSAVAAEPKPPQEPKPVLPVVRPSPDPAATRPVLAAVAAPDSVPSEAERKLLLDLRARREALDLREKAVDSRDVLLKAAERGLTDRLDQLTALQTRLESLDRARRERDDANWRSLVKTYETMRPRDAAAIFNELEQDVLIQVLDRMKEARVAPILAAMQPDRARTATAQLAQWRNRSVGGTQG